jgi:hypothetical protein
MLLAMSGRRRKGLHIPEYTLLSFAEISECGHPANHFASLVRR